jgi:glutamine amidotransferase
MSNLGSISNALAECGAENVVVATDSKELADATHVVLPGVGAFSDGMYNIKKFGWIKSIQEVAINKKIPFLGICLGMQLLASKGYEGGETEGLGLVKGVVDRLKPTSKDERIPHVGWNEVYPAQDSPLFENILHGTDYYFVHSYHFKTEDKKNILATTPYCGRFVSCVTSGGNIFGTQFHPEKSQRPGFQLLKNFLKL